MPIAAVASLLLAAGSPALGDGTALAAFVDRIYAPYRSSSDPRPLAERGVWSAPTEQLFQAWQQRHPDARDLSGADVLCDCRDWDAPDFRVETLTRMFTGPGKAVILLRVWPQQRRSSEVRLSLVKEGGRWSVEDVGDPSSARSLTSMLRR